VAKAKQERSVTLYGTVVLQGARGARIAQSFEQKYGITVNAVGGSGSQVFQRVQQEIRNGVPSADVVNFYPPWQNTFEAAGYFQSLEGKSLPMLAEPASVWEMQPSALRPSLTYLSMRTAYGYPITVNKSLLSPADYPTSFHQMATDPKYYGKIGWVDPHTTQDPAFKWVGFGYVAKAMSLEDVWRIYTQQKPVLYEAPQSETGPLARGEVALIMGGNAGAEAVQGAPVESVSFPDVPVVTTPSVMGMVKDASHPNAALVFINWVFSNEGQTAITKVGANPSTRTDVPDGVPQAVAQGVISGGGKAGPDYLYSAMQSQLAADVYKDANGAWIGLTSGISLDDFTNAINQYVNDWEAQHGDQSQPLLAK
jgi:iron(III) transport system substrate-binding protein